MPNKKQSLIIRDRANPLVVTLLDGLLAVGKVKVTGLGIFEVRKSAAKVGYNPATGGKKECPAYNRIHFTPTKELRNLIQ